MSDKCAKDKCEQCHKFEAEKDFCQAAEKVIDYMTNDIIHNPAAVKSMAHLQKACDFWIDKIGELLAGQVNAYFDHLRKEYGLAEDCEYILILREAAKRGEISPELLAEAEKFDIELQKRRAAMDQFMNTIQQAADKARAQAAQEAQDDKEDILN